MMPKRSSKSGKRRDVNELAAGIIAAVTSEPAGDVPEKNPAAVALGKLGGLKGGKARAAKLSAKKRKEIARLGALARWSRNTEKDSS